MGLLHRCLRQCGSEVSCVLTAIPASSADPGGAGPRQGIAGAAAVRLSSASRCAWVRSWHRRAALVRRVGATAFALACRLALHSLGSREEWRLTTRLTVERKPCNSRTGPLHPSPPHCSLVSSRVYPLWRYTHKRDDGRPQRSNSNLVCHLDSLRPFTAQRRPSSPLPPSPWLGTGWSTSRAKRSSGRGRT